MESSPRFQKSTGVKMCTQSLSFIDRASWIVSSFIFPMFLYCDSGIIVKMWISSFFASSSEISYSSSIFFAACCGMIPIEIVCLFFFRNSVLNLSISFWVLSIFFFSVASIWLDIGRFPILDFGMYSFARFCSTD